MAFDPTTARPADSAARTFDPSTAVPLDDEGKVKRQWWLDAAGAVGEAATRSVPMGGAAVDAVKAAPAVAEFDILRPFREAAERANERPASNPLSRGVHWLGEAAAGVATVPLGYIGMAREGVGKALDALGYDESGLGKADARATAAVGGAIGTGLDVLGRMPVVKQLNEWGGRNPEAAALLEDAANILPVAVTPGALRSVGAAVERMRSPEIADAVAKARAGGARMAPPAPESAAQLVERIRGSLDPEGRTVEVPGIGRKRLQDVTESDLQAGLSVVAPQETETVEALTAAKRALAPDAPRLRRDLQQQPYTRDELKKIRKGGSIEPVSYEGQAISAQAPIAPTGLQGVGRAIDNQVIYELNQPWAESTPGFDKLVDIAANDNKRANNALMVAGESSLGKAFEDFDRVIAQKASQKEKLLQNAKKEGVTVDLSDIKNEWRQQVEMVARASLVKDENGKWSLRHPDSGGHKLNPENDQAIIDITEALDRVPDKADPKWADDVKRRIQAVARSTSYTPTGTVPSEAKRLSLAFSGKINKRLGEVLGDQYRNINADLHDYIGLEDLLGKVLGKQIIISQSPREGGGLIAQGVHKNVAQVMKQGAESVTRADLQELFNAVERLSGGKHNPTQAALAAQAAMILAGRKPMFGLADLPTLMGASSLNPNKLAMVAAKTPSIIGRVASGGKDDAAYLVDYWRAAQARHNRRPPPAGPEGQGAAGPGPGPVAGPGPAVGPGAPPAGTGSSGAQAPAAGAGPVEPWLADFREAFKDWTVDDRGVVRSGSAPAAGTSKPPTGAQALDFATARRALDGLPPKLQDQLLSRLQRRNVGIDEWKNLVAAIKARRAASESKALENMARPAPAGTAAGGLEDLRLADDPFAGLGVLTKQQLKERENIGMRFGNEPDLPAEALDPEFDIGKAKTQAQLDDEDLAAYNDMERFDRAKAEAQKQAAVARREAELQLGNRHSFGLGHGEIDPGKLSEQKIEKINKWLLDYNKALENDHANWYRRYGEMGYPEVESWAIGDFLHWINQGPSTRAQLNMMQ